MASYLMQPCGMDFERDTSAGYLVNLMARLFARQLEAQLRQHGLALGVFPALLHLWQEDGLTQRDLVGRLGIEQPTMAATLSRMQRDGLITRHLDATDARVQHLRLTEKARNLQRPAEAEAAAVNARALAGLSRDEQTAFLATISRVIANLGLD